MVGSVPGAVIVVEGESDRVAVKTAAGRLGRDLTTEGVDVVALGGATNVGAYLVGLLEGHRGLRLAGLYDAPEERFFARGLERAGLGPVPGRDRLEQLGFFACEQDLEDELIRSVGERTMIDLIDKRGELASFGLLQRQPVQRSWSQHRQLRRFLRARSGNKATYAKALVEAMDPADIPRPLQQVLSRV